MNFYIVDDDPAIPIMLQRIIEQNPNNNVVATTYNAQTALKDLSLLNVDIALVDLLIPKMTGIELVEKIKKQKPTLRFIMISQVRDSDLRAQAYQAGIEFFIDKPINVIEVKTVIEKVIQNIKMATKINNIQSLVNNNNPTINTQKYNQASRDKILSILRYLGISSAEGSSDILAILQLMLEQKCTFQKLDIQKQYHINTNEKKILFQRIRRALKTGLTNLALLCLDNFGDEITIEYANELYEYKNVHLEMLFLEGKRTTGGKVSLKRFFNGLLQESQLE
ncbi:DNA-binding domain-containing protein [Bombilactobacillus bombi]|uniref:DNA-binding domain-containing protein n=1 Tax=Bombilactobacillus bombi TaxID=1303590 RepID=UPI0015E5DA0F|nr:DNA-binding domain-containing protein [Bombilactobacillus bombi]MBA1435125.1 response regulator [Bombilactobacillus bombi]